MKNNILKKGLVKSLIVLSLTGFALTGCTKVKKSSSFSNYSNYNYEYSNNATSYDNNSDNYSLNNIEFADQYKQTGAYLSGEGYNSFISYLNDLSFGITNEEVISFTNASCVKQVRRVIHTSCEHGIIKNGKVDVNALFNVVKKNNEEYQNLHRNAFYMFIEDDKELMEVLNVFVNGINSSIDKVDNKNYGELDCFLSDLKVFYVSNINNASVTYERCLLVNPSMIKISGYISGNSESFRNTLYHEGKHVYQLNCKCYENDENYYIGLSRENDSLDINPYKWSWSTEATAEKLVSDETKDDPIVYKYLVGYVDSMDYVALLNNDSNYIDDIERSSINKDVNYLYRVMGLNYGLSEDEITKMMYAMELVQGGGDNFFKKIEERKGIVLTDEQKLDIRRSLRADFCALLSKVFYSNLSGKIKEKGNLSLEDVFALIKIFEADINYHICFTTDSSDYTKRFINTYSGIQENFFKSLSKSSNIDYNELISYYREYKPLIKNGEIIKINASLSFLSEIKKNEILNNCLNNGMYWVDGMVCDYLNAHKLSK